MADVFISYRRADTGDIAGRIADHLKELPQVSSVFLDVDSIPSGDHFATKIKDVLDKSDICLILIGDKWHGPQEDGAPARLDNPEDLVRIEAAHVLATNRKTIPVLVNGAKMPSEDMLPAELQSLPTMNGFPLRTETFRRDIEALFDQLFGTKRLKPGLSIAQRIMRGGLYAMGGLLAAGTALLLFALGYRLLANDSLNALVGYDRGTMMVVIASILGVGAVIGGWLSRR